MTRNSPSRVLSLAICQSGGRGVVGRLTGWPAGCRRAPVVTAAAAAGPEIVNAGSVIKFGD